MDRAADADQELKITAINADQHDHLVVDPS